MRATLKTSTSLMLSNMLNNYSSLVNVQNQMASGRRVNNPSDDALATNAAMRYDTILSQITRYQSNITTGNSNLGLSDATLGDVNDLTNSVTSLLVASANSTTDASANAANADEVAAALDELVALGNTQEGSRYLFGGTMTTTTPFTLVDGGYICYNGNDEDVNLEMDAGTYVPINVTGNEAFGSLTTSVKSTNLSALANLSAGTGTKLSDLNNGKGVASGSITVRYTASPVGTGLTIDLSSAKTLEDVADLVEQAADQQAASTSSNYTLEVSLNAEQDGLEITQVYVSTGAAVPTTDASAVAIRIADIGGNTTASDLGIDGTGTVTSLEGDDIFPVVGGSTLLSDLENYEDNSISITNGEKAGTVSVGEVNGDNDAMNDWNISGLAAGTNCTDEGNFYVKVTTATVSGVTTYDMDLYSGSEMLDSQLIASGTTGASGTVTLSSQNNSGVSGTVSLSTSYVASDGEYDFTMLADLTDSSYAATISVPAFTTSGSDIGTTGFATDDLFGSWQIHGLDKGVDTDSAGSIYTQLVDNGGGTYSVNLYTAYDSGTGIYSGLMATGTLTGTAGEVTLTGAAGHEDVTGSVYVSIPASAEADISAAGATGVGMTVTATFATVDDLITAVNASGTYTTAKLNTDGSGITITSRLSGAYLTVAQNVTTAYVAGDESQQLTQVNLSGIVSSVNADSDGSLYSSVAYDATSGIYTVSFYSDSEMTSLVASGTSTSASGLVSITEQNESGLTGSVYLDYVADDSDIEVRSGSVDVLGDEVNQVSQVDLTGLTAGLNSSYKGSVYATVALDGGTNQVVVNLYSDVNHSYLIATGSLAAGLTTGTINFTEQNGSGIGTSSLYINYTQDDSDIEIINEDSGIYGQSKADNIFSVLHDAIDAMNANDVAAVAALITPLSDAANQVTSARADVGGRVDRLTLLSSRHLDSTTNFNSLKSDEIDLDYATAITDYQLASNAYEASLSVSAKIMGSSLLDYM